MKSINAFVVRIQKPLKEEITLSNGLKLFVDNKFNEFEHRVSEGEVVATPAKYDLGVSVGDTIYFHHHVVIGDGQKVHWEDDLYFVYYDPDKAVMSQAIAYKNSQGEVKCLSNWFLLTSTNETESIDSESVILDHLKKDVKNEAVIDCLPAKYDIEVKEKDVVGFKKNSDYEITIDDHVYFRVREDDILYVKESV